MSQQVIHTAISEQPLDPGAAEAAVWTSTAGAVVGFSGIVRNHDGGQGVTALRYSAHPQAENTLQQVAEAVAEDHPQVRFWVAHRIGDLSIGDYALVAACASAHRAEAFAACAALVERVKAEVPIWKEQFFTDGSREWVGL